jgi:thiamine pyrophosphate-dependent acetolactate synthase large subunit-like protein
VVAFTGDGGFLMMIAERQTAQRENLPIIVLVFDNQEIGLIGVKRGERAGHRLEHDPEKWIPVFGKDHAQT